MAYPKKSPAVQFHVDCVQETKNLFNKIHQASGFKTKAETFAAVIYTMATRDTLDPHLLQRLEFKLDRALERYDDLV